MAVLASVVCVAVGATSAYANPARSLRHAVPSHTPAATHRLWERLVHRPHRALTSTASCTPIRILFYTEDDWLRLATKLAANADPCAQYFISIPPLAADKTSFRTAQAAQISALGPNFHPVGEVNYNGWSSWVSANNSTFYDAGIEARKRLAAAGYETWAVNELSSAVRAGTNVARQKVRDLVRGLYTGDGTLPQAKGIVFDIGINQSTGELSSYKVALQNWYQDSAFWQDMSAYVSDWSQELYGDVRDEAVSGAPVATRVQYLDDFLGHQLRLAEVAPPSAAAARTFLDQADSPLATAAWMWSSGFGYTNVPVDQMEDYVSAQVDALRTLPRSSFGFAWAPQMADGSSWTSQFTADTGALIDRLAAAIHDSAGSPDGACGTSWCTAGLAGAAFTDAWQTFASWSPTTAVFTSGPATATVGTASSQLVVGLQTDGVPQVALADTQVRLSSSSTGGRFSTNAGGPWTATLSLTIPQGSSSAGFYYEDSQAGMPTVTADGATQTETIVATPPATPTPTPAPAPPSSSGGGSGGVPPDLHVELTADHTAAPPGGSELVYRVAVTSTNAGSASDARLALTLPAGYAVTQVYADRGPGCTGTVPMLSCDLGWISPGTGTTLTITGTVGTSDPVGDLVASAGVTSVVEPEASDADNTATLTLAPPQQTAAPQTVGPPTLARPRIVRSGSLLRAVGSTAKTYRWQYCTAQKRCNTIRGATHAVFRLTRRDRGRRIRVVVTALVGGHLLTAMSTPLLVRR